METLTIIDKSDATRQALPDAEIIKQAKQFCVGLLGYRGETHSRCFIVSVALAGYLNAIGVDCILVEGRVNRNHHFWVGFKDGRIIDATANQFGLRNVWLQHSKYHRVSHGGVSNTVNSKPK